MDINYNYKVYIVKKNNLHGPLYPFEIKELVLAKYKAEIQASQAVITPATSITDSC